jgi:DNA-binding MarR family transcriptional regulator
LYGYLKNKEVIKINKNNRQESYTLVDGKYEYRRIPLDEFQSKYIYIPLSVITDAELDTKRVGIFSYLRIHCGLNSVVGFTIPDMVEWYGGKPDRRVNGTNDKTLSILDTLGDRGYLTYLTEKSRSSYMKCKFDIKYYYEACSDGYAVIYLDELDKIMNYQKENANDNILNNTTILLVFAYLRNKIRRRPNELAPEERTSDGIKKRKERMPDAYDSNINDIANELNISSKTLSKIIDILEHELGLIVTDRAYRVKNENDEFRTLPTIFANAYKREDKYLLDTGNNYSRTEIELKAENMKKYYQGYKIDKKKRKNKKEGDGNHDE